MPETPTTRLGLYKPLNDGSENVNVTTDLNNNWDKIDPSVGFQIVTSSTRPSSPYAGKPIAESDTSYRTFFSNGTSPASASWVEIPNSSGTYGGNINLEGTKQINIGGSGSTAAYAIRLATATGDFAISSRAVGDTQSRSTLRADGQLGWGPGNAATDVFLARSATSTLTLTGNLTVTGVGQERYVVKPSSTARTSTTTLADDPHLAATVVASGVYVVRLVVFATTADAANTDIQTAWNVPAGSTGLKMCHGPTDSAADYTSRSNTRGRFSGHGYTTAVNYQAESGAVAIVEESIITIGGTAGSVTLQWAQTVSDTDAVTVTTSSYLYIKRLA